MYILFSDNKTACDESLICIYSLQINVRVTTMDAELEFAIQSATTGKQLFEQVRFSCYSNV